MFIIDQVFYDKNGIIDKLWVNLVKKWTTII